MAVRTHHAFSGLGSLLCGYELRDLHTELCRAFEEMIPSECARPLRGELVVEQDGVVIVQQDEVFADRQSKPASDVKACVFSATNL